MWTVWRRDIDARSGQGGPVSSPRRGYPSDLTDAQWALIEDLLPEPNTDGRREIVNAILYLVRSGCPWRYLPVDLPPWQSVYWYFVRWEDAGVTENLLATLRVEARVQDGRNPEPSAGIIDSQSVKGADTVGTDTRGYDAWPPFATADPARRADGVWRLVERRDRDPWTGRGQRRDQWSATPR